MNNRNTAIFFTLTIMMTSLIHDAQTMQPPPPASFKEIALQLGDGPIADSPDRDLVNKLLEKIFNHKGTAATTDHLGRTILHYAARNKQVNLIRCIYQQICKHDAQTSNIRDLRMQALDDALCTGDFQGNTPLHYAAATGDPATIKALLACMSDDTELLLQATDMDDRTPLHYAAEKGDAANISTLIECTLDDLSELLEATDKHGKTPLNVVQSIIKNINLDTNRKKELERFLDAEKVLIVAAEIATMP